MSQNQVATTQTAAPVEKRGQQTVRDLIEGASFRDAVARVLPKHLTPDRFVRIAIAALTRTPKLRQCDPKSLLGALMNLSQMGLEPDGRRAHLIPFFNSRLKTFECQLIIDYKGLVELAMRSGVVASIHADLVCENDQFAYNCGQVEKHEINFREARGKPYAAYAVCRFKDKDALPKCEVMTVAEIDAVRRRSKAADNGPWTSDWGEMAKKTVFRRLAKWLPLSAEYRDAVEADSDAIEVPANVAAPVAFSRPLFEAPAALEDAGEPTATAAPNEPAPTAEEEAAMGLAPEQPKPNSLKELRNLCKIEKIKEGELLDYLSTTGITDGSLSSLEELQLQKDMVVAGVCGNWTAIAADFKARKAVAK